MTELDADLHRKTVRATVATRLLVIAAVLLAAVIVTLQLTATIQTQAIARSIRSQQNSNTSTVTGIQDLAEKIRSCTTPGQPCYKAGQERTAAAVGDINEVVVYAAACADRPRQQSVAEIQACVIRRLAESQP